MNKLSVIATINTHLLKQDILESFIQSGATILRINGSHVTAKDFKFYVNEIQKHVGNKVEILIDLPGNKIRTAPLPQPIPLVSGERFELFPSQVNFPDFIHFLKKGDVLFANDSLYEFNVVETQKDRVVLISKTDGLLTSNKGIHLPSRTLDLPFLFERDKELIQIAKETGVQWMGLSFVRKVEDVREAKSLAVGSGLRPIVKVETLPAVQNLDSILDEAEYFLVDRGDLSCDVGLESVDLYQKKILRAAKNKNKKIFFATQFLHSMLQNRIPLIAEVCGLTDALQLGVDGIQLSEETAIGKHPLEVLNTVQKINKTAVKKLNKNLFKKINSGAPVLWFTGRSGSGKTTISKRLIEELNFWGIKAGLVDGDEFRDFWGNEAGYSKEDRIKNQKNIIFTAAQAAKSFDLVIVSTLSPYTELRSLAREKISNFHEVYISCPQNLCIERDPKGHYKKAIQGDTKNFVGISQEYEEPKFAELTVQSDQLNLNQCVDKIKDYIFEK